MKAFVFMIQQLTFLFSPVATVVENGNRRRKSFHFASFLCSLIFLLPPPSLRTATNCDENFFIKLTQKEKRAFLSSSLLTTVEGPTEGIKNKNKNLISLEKVPCTRISRGMVGL
jgi:hypothetical protein